MHYYCSFTDNNSAAEATYPIGSAHQMWKQDNAMLKDHFIWEEQSIRNAYRRTDDPGSIAERDAKLAILETEKSNALSRYSRIKKDMKLAEELSLTLNERELLNGA